MILNAFQASLLGIERGVWLARSISRAVQASSFPFSNQPPKEMAVVQHQWYHFGVGVPPISVYFTGDWDVHWGYDLDFDPWPR